MINNRYTIKMKIGEGRSSVFLCTDNDIPGKEIALKALFKEAGKDETQKFKEEYFTIRKLQHPNIIQAYEIGAVVKANLLRWNILKVWRYWNMTR